MPDPRPAAVSRFIICQTIIGFLLLAAPLVAYWLTEHEVLWANWFPLLPPTWVFASFLTAAFAFFASAASNTGRWLWARRFTRILQFSAIAMFPFVIVAVCLFFGRGVFAGGEGSAYSLFYFFSLGGPVIVLSVAIAFLAYRSLRLLSDPSYRVWIATHRIQSQWSWKSAAAFLVVGMIYAAIAWYLTGSVRVKWNLKDLGCTVQEDNGYFSIWLSNHKATDATLRQVVNLLKGNPRFFQMWQCDLTDSQITDDGLQILSELPDAIQDLNVTRTRITDAGMVHIAALSRLNSLNLSDTSITDAGIAHLRNRTYGSVNTYNTRITPAGAKLLKINATLTQ
jgi:hypothetical protein